MISIPLLLLLAFRLFEVDGRYQNPTRQQLVNALPYKNNGLSSGAKNFLRGFPRAGQPRQLGVVDLDEFQGGGVFVWWSTSKGTAGGTHEYFQGILGMVVVCMIFASLSISACTVFCLGRCICDSFGGRQVQPPETKYPIKHITLLRLAVCLLIVFMVILFSFTLTSNTGVSMGEDKTFYALEGVENYLWEFMGPLNTLDNYSVSTLGLAQGVNSLALTTLPSDSDIVTYRDCLNTSYTALQQQDAISARVEDMDTAMKGVNFTTFNSQLVQLQTKVPLIPDLDALDNENFNFNTTVYALPNLTSISLSLTTLASSLTVTTAMTTTSNNLNLIQSQKSSMNIPAIISTLAQFENAILSLPDLDEIYGQVDGTRSTSQSGLTSLLDSLDSSLASFPNGTQMAIDLTSLNTSLYALMQEVTAKDSLVQIQDAINSMPNLDSLTNSISQLQSMRITLLNRASSLSTNAANANKNTSFLTTLLPSLLLQVNNAKSLSSAQVDSTIQDLMLLNSSLNTIKCLSPLYTVLIKVNSSLFYLPTEVEPFFTYKHNVEAETVGTLSSDLNQSTIMLQQFSTKLGSIPNLIILEDALLALNASFSVVRLDLLANQTADIVIQTSLLPSLPNFMSGIQNLNISLNDMPDLTPTINSLGDLNTSLLGIPPLASYIFTFQQSERGHQNLSITIPQAKANMDTNGVIQGSVKDTLLVQLQSFNTTITGRSSSTTLSNSLTTLQNSLNNLPDLATLKNNLDLLQSTSVNLPGSPTLNSLRNPLNLLDNAVQRPTVSFLAATGALHILNQSLAQLPPLAPYVISTQGLQSYSYNLAPIVNVTSNSSGWLTIPMITAVDQTLTDFKSSRSSLQNFNSTVANLTKSVNHLSEQVDGLRDKRYTFDASKNTAYNDVQAWDLVRLFFTNFLAALPVAISLMGVGACLFMRGCPAMIMALSTFGVIALFLFLACMQVPVATVLADHCPNATDFIQMQFDGKDNISKEEFFNMTGIPVTQNVSYGTTFRYLTTCEGQRPEFLVLLQNPLQFLNDTQGYNFTKLRLDVINAAGNLTLHPSIISDFNKMDQYTGNASSLVNNTIQTLVDCEKIDAVMDPVIDSLCTDFAGALALNTCLFVLTAFCMIPGICIGIKGYKWFDPRYVGENPKGHPINAGEGEGDIPLQPVGKANKKRQISQLPPGAIHAEGGAIILPGGNNKLWTCAYCVYQNQPSVKTCQNCGIPRFGAGGGEGEYNPY